MPHISLSQASYKVSIGNILEIKELTKMPICPPYIDGLVQDCRHSIANALELL